MSLLQWIPYHFVALLLGTVAGLIFAAAWKYFFPAGTQGRFWMSLSVLSQDALTVDSLSGFLALYRQLGATLLAFLARNIAAVGVGGLAIILTIVGGLGPLGKHIDVKFGTLRASNSVVERTAQQQNGKLIYQVGQVPIPIASNQLSTRLAVCWSRPSCLGLALLNFQLIELPKAPPGLTRPVIFRADHGVATPLWPYLSSLEAVFLLALLVSMPVGMLRMRKGPDSTAARPPMLQQSDFALVQLSSQLRPLWHVAGNLETRWLRRSLGSEALRAPIFVAGMARSGTTTLLNALTQSSELGAHQYRDFPFLMAPVAWNRLQGAIATDAQAVERPHKDRILITKFSHDAFEEPLWQAFFPHLHDPDRDQRLGPDVSNPGFEAFFTEHIRKILYLRNAARYISKGNYNVGRIEYLGKLFPDAQFIIPVRAPLEHVASLVRQHELFCTYAESDPRVPLYLAAAGHYEFGPQRRAIHLSSAARSTPPGSTDGEDDAITYARQWGEVYGHILRVKRSNTTLSDRIRVVRYEDFCASPSEELGHIIRACGLTDPAGSILAFANTITESRAPIPAAVEGRRAEIEAVVRPVASALGYNYI